MLRSRTRPPKSAAATPDDRRAHADPAPELSLVAPVYDEVANLRPLYARCAEALPASLRWELVFVDDGSRDGSDEVIRQLAEADPRVRGVFFAHNCGQSSATRAGVLAARAPLVATLDADLQNDPADLVPMLAALGEHDAVVGYRTERKDDWLRRVSSRVANRIRNRVTGDAIRDTGCSLKVFRAQALRELYWFEGLHRFLPTLLRFQGFSVIEHPVSHHARIAGRSKYGVRNRALRAFVDLLVVRWMRSRTIKMPIVAPRTARERQLHGGRR